jgi:O-6-methylguanine DNA methyltransferase
MPKVRKTLGLCNRARKRFATFTATSSECESSCYLHGMFPEEEIAHRSKRHRHAKFLRPAQLLHNSGLDEMIDVYTKNIAGVWFGVACDEQRIFGTSFALSEQKALKSLLSGIPFNVPFQVFSVPSAFAENILTLVKDVYDGKDVLQGFPLVTEHLPAYTRRVLEVTSLVPVGYVASYGSIAKAAGGSPRAVGNVMAANTFAPIVPCHRVVSSDFTLGGYGGGLDVKLEFLTREKRGYQSPREILLGQRKLVVFPVEFVLRKLRKIR